MSRVPSLGAVLPQIEMQPCDVRCVRSYVEAIAAAGFDHVLAYDHVLGADSRSRPDWAGHYDHEDPFLEPLTLFAFLSGVTELELVTDVLVLPQRQTALVAKQAATVDVLSSGRLRLGVGIGWNEVEYASLGVRFATRARRLEEQIGLLRELWTRTSVDHRGEFDTVDRAGINPQPVQQPIPIWIGASDVPAALERVGRLADGWIPHPNMDDDDRIVAAWRAVREAAERAGRDPDSLGMQGHVRHRETPIAHMAGRLERWVEMGATHVDINTLEAGLTWPQGHLDAIAEIGQLWQDALGPGRRG